MIFLLRVNYVTRFVCNITGNYIVLFVGALLYLNLSRCQSSQRLGGSALAQVYRQTGNECPDLDDTELFGAAFNAIQHLVKGACV